MVWPQDVEIEMAAELVVEVVKELAVVDIPLVLVLVFDLVSLVLIFVFVVETEDDPPLQQVPKSL